MGEEEGGISAYSCVDDVDGGARGRKTSILTLVTILGAWEQPQKREQAIMWHFPHCWGCVLAHQCPFSAGVYLRTPGRRSLDGKLWGHDTRQRHSNWYVWAVFQEVGPQLSFLEGNLSASKCREPLYYLQDRECVLILLALDSLLPSIVAGIK